MDINLEHLSGSISMYEHTFSHHARLKKILRLPHSQELYMCLVSAVFLVLSEKVPLSSRESRTKNKDTEDRDVVQ